MLLQMFVKFVEVMSLKRANKSLIRHAMFAQGTYETFWFSDFMLVLASVSNTSVVSKTTLKMSSRNADAINDSKH